MKAKELDPRLPNNNDVAKMVNECIELWVKYKDVNWERDSPEIWDTIFKDIRRCAAHHRRFQTPDGKVFVSSMLKMFLRILDERDKEAQRRKKIRKMWEDKKEAEMIAQEQRREAARERKVREKVEEVRKAIRAEEKAMEEEKAEEEDPSE